MCVALELSVIQQGLEKGNYLHLQFKVLFVPRSHQNVS
jgi:hypothetical protein